MKYIWVFLIGIPLLVVATYISIKNKKRVLEKFGVFGESKITYVDLVKAKYTEKELPKVREDWEKKSMEEKTKEIELWDKLSPKQQNDFVIFYKQQKEGRQQMESI